MPAWAAEMCADLWSLCLEQCWCKRASVLPKANARWTRRRRTLRVSVFQLPLVCSKCAAITVEQILKAVLHTCKYGNKYAYYSICFPSSRDWSPLGANDLNCSRARHPNHTPMWNDLDLTLISTCLGRDMSLPSGCSDWGRVTVSST